MNDYSNPDSWDPQAWLRDANDDFDDRRAEAKWSGEMLPPVEKIPEYTEPDEPNACGELAVSAIVMAALAALSWWGVWRAWRRIR